MLLNSLEIRVREAQDGMFVASCPDLGLFSQAATEEEALARIEGLIAFQLTCTEGLESLAEAARSRRRRAAGAGAECKVLYMPHRVHVQ